jgi:hypothetical protein
MTRRIKIVSPAMTVELDSVEVYGLYPCKYWPLESEGPINGVAWNDPDGADAELSVKLENEGIVLDVLVNGEIVATASYDVEWLLDHTF